MGIRRVPMASLTPLMEEILSAGGCVEMTVTGSSMEPLLHDRQSIVRLRAPGNIVRGDLPLYRRRDGAYVLHRVTAADAGSVTCCGDAQCTLERGVAREQIVAVTEAFSRRGTRWISSENWLYRVYWQTWLAIMPLRRLSGAVRGRLRRIARRCKGENG